MDAGIDPGMALTQFLSSIGRDLNPRPSNRELSLLTTRPDFRQVKSLRSYVLKKAPESLIILGPIVINRSQNFIFPYF